MIPEQAEGKAIGSVNDGYEGVRFNFEDGSTLWISQLGGGNARDI